MQGTTGKIVLVVLGVLLMLVFILPSGLRNAGRGDPSVGTLDGASVRAGDVRAAGALLAYAASNVQLQSPQTGQSIPLPAAIFGPAVADRMEKDPQLFYLLLTEARRDGQQTPAADVTAFLDNPNVVVLVGDAAAAGGRQPRAFKDIPGRAIRESVLAAVTAVADVAQSRARFADFYKVSRPVLDYHLALENQRVGLKTVVFDARDYLADAPEPDAAALTAQFERYKDVAPAGGDTPAGDDDPFGFGYRLPARAKFQYLSLPAAAAADRVRRDMQAQDLRGREQALYRYWSDNRARFPVPPGSPVTRPSSQPATRPSTEPDAAAEVAGADEPTTRPASDSILAAENPVVQDFLDQQTATVNGTADEATWRSFLAVHDDVARTDLAERGRELRAKVVKRMRDLLTSDYRAFDTARAAAEPGDAGSGLAVDDPSYLDAAADTVAEETGVRPDVASYGRDFHDREGLSSVAEVGAVALATLGNGSPGSAIGFADYLLAATSPLLSDEQRSQIESTGLLLKLYQPSQTIRDFTGGEYVFRVTAAAPAAAAPSLAEVEDRVRRDLKLEAGYGKALAEARAMATAAQSQGSLAAAAEAAGRPLFSPPPFVPAGLVPDPRAFGAGPTSRPSTGPAPAAGDDEPTTLDRPTRRALAEGIYRLLGRPGETPVEVLPLQPAFRAVVAELASAAGTWPDDQKLAQLRVQVREQLASQAAGNPAAGEDPIGAEFFDADRVAARLGFTPSAPAEGQ